MDAKPPHEPPELSPVVRYGLFVAGLVVSLLGLTLLDVQAEKKHKRSLENERSAECIVASAVFAGVSPLPGSDVR